MNPFPETTIDEVVGCLHNESDRPPVTDEEMHSACVEMAAQRYLEFKLNEQDDDTP